MIITSAQILGYYSYYTGLVNQQGDQISQESVFKPVYIIQIFNSQHGWICLWLSIISIMIEVFKVALAQWLLLYQWI